MVNNSTSIRHAYPGTETSARLIQQHACDENGACRTYSRREADIVPLTNADGSKVIGRLDYQVYDSKPKVESSIWGLVQNKVVETKYSCTRCDIIQGSDGQKSVGSCESEASIYSRKP